MFLVPELRCIGFAKEGCARPGWPGETEGFHCWERNGTEDKSGSHLSGMGLRELIEPGGRQGDLFYAPSRSTSIQIYMQIEA